MAGLGKLLMLAGVFLLVIGALVWAISRTSFRGLPGDFRFQGQRVQIYFPIATCIVLSLLLTGILWIVQWWGRK